MECNRDEATRAKEIAERKFNAKDMVGAKKFALKAKSLYPNLEGISQMLATLDVYISAENKIGGEADWYGILGVSSFSDDEMIKKQFRKLALLLHPDKNKSIGADGAFKLISEAWSLLSDKTKRVAYEQKRNPKTTQPKYPPTCRSAPATNGFANNNPNTKTHKSTPHVGPTTAPASAAPTRPPKSKTFWTSCNRCKMQYEYLRMYQNRNLLCPNCRQPFLAIETPCPLPGEADSSPTQSFSQQNQNPNHHTTKKNTYASKPNSATSPNLGSSVAGNHGSVNQTNFQWGSSPGVGNAAHIAQQAYEKARRQAEEALAEVRRKDALQKKHPLSKRSASNAGFSNPGTDFKREPPVKRTRGFGDSGESDCRERMFNQMAPGSGGISTGSASGYGQGGYESVWANWFSTTNPLNGTRDLTPVELRDMWIVKAKREILKKLNEWKSSAASNGIEGERKKEPFVVNTHAQKKPVELNAKKNPSNSVSEMDDPLSITVPDPDFYDFDKDRSEKSFAENQVWAAYDDDDGMPRFYAMIQKVISLNPFKMRISWLNSKTNSELGPIDWVGSGFSKTCGEFRVGRYENSKSLNSFSHKVKWSKGARGTVQIFPMKGDVWALYQNWSPDWNESTPDELIYKYEMVHVLDDYNEEQGVRVAPLVKIAGFKTVFHRHLDPGQHRRIPREEMFRFSHQVPSYLLTGEEALNAPKGCHELDPAATPIELLQVITEAKEEDTRKEAKKEVIEIV